MSGVGGTALGTAVTQRAFAPATDVRVNTHEIVFVCDVPVLTVRVPKKPQARPRRIPIVSGQKQLGEKSEKTENKS